jgi:hypothetical protein
MARTVTPPPLPVDESEEISDIDQEDDFEPAPTSHRIIDWVKVFTVPVLVTFNVFLISIALEELSKQTPNQAALGQVMYVVGIVGLVAVPIVFLSALISQLMGAYFNVAKDRISYPYFAWRLRLPLSGIRDANAQTISKRGVDVLASLGEKNPKHKTVHHYHVNLSGDFGARRLMFRSKFKRDQFLSILRSIRPDVRITRWS